MPESSGGKALRVEGLEVGAQDVAVAGVSVSDAGGQLFTRELTMPVSYEGSMFSYLALS